MLRCTEEEKDELRELMRKAPKAVVRTKATALWNLCRGKRREEVADFLGVSKASITAWTQHFRAEGAKGLEIRPGRGRKAVAKKEELEEYIRQSPRTFGLPQTRWTLRALAAVVPSLRGFSEAGVWKVLNRAGFRYKRGQPAIHSPDPEYGEKRGPWNRPSRKPSRGPSK